MSDAALLSKLGVKAVEQATVESKVQQVLQAQEQLHEAKRRRKRQENEVARLRKSAENARKEGGAGAHLEEYREGKKLLEMLDKEVAKWAAIASKQEDSEYLGGLGRTIFTNVLLLSKGLFGILSSCSQHLFTFFLGILRMGKWRRVWRWMRGIILLG